MLQSNLSCSRLILEASGHFESVSLFVCHAKHNGVKSFLRKMLFAGIYLLYKEALGELRAKLSWILKEFFLGDKIPIKKKHTKDDVGKNIESTYN